MQIRVDEVGAVIHPLLNQMAAVARGVNQDVVGLDLKPALDNGLEVFVLDFKFLEGQIIHVDNEFVIAVLDAGDNALQVLELMLVDLNHAQALVVVFVENRLDARAFPRARIPVEQDIIGLAPLHKSLGIGGQPCLLALITHDIGQTDVTGGRNRL